MKVGTETGTIYEDTDSVGIINSYKRIMDKAYYKKDELPDYMQRVYDECRELNEKRNKLSIYLAKESQKTYKDCQSCRLKELDLMRRQLNFMEQYQEMLLQRLDMYV